MSDADPGSPSGMRASNRERILALLRARGPCPRPIWRGRAACRRRPSRGSRASCASPAGSRTTTRRARARRALALSRSAGVAVGIDFGHSHVRVAVADLAHTVLAEAEEPLDVDHEADEGIALAGRLVRGCSTTSASRSTASPASAWACPARCAATAARSATRRSCPAGSASRAEALMQRRARPAGARRERRQPRRAGGDRLGRRPRLPDLVYVKVATGVGAGLVLNGRLYHGAGGTAGEIGHVTIDDGGPVCRCGNRGCLEAFAGAEAILEPLRRRHGERLTLRQVVVQAQAGDVGCRRVIADAGRALGRAVAGTCNLLSPERVLVGGELAQAGDLLLESVREAVAPLGHRRHPRGADPRRRPRRARRGAGRGRARPARVSALRGRAGARPLGHRTYRTQHTRREQLRD